MLAEAYLEQESDELETPSVSNCPDFAGSSSIISRSPWSSIIFRSPWTMVSSVSSATLTSEDEHLRSTEAAEVNRGEWARLTLESQDQPMNQVGSKSWSAVQGAVNLYRWKELANEFSAFDARKPLEVDVLIHTFAWNFRYA